jgi:hypothetical protein
LASFVFPSYAAWLARSSPFHVISTCPRDGPLPLVCRFSSFFSAVSLPPLPTTPPRFLPRWAPS